MGRAIAVAGIVLSVGTMIGFNLAHKLSLALFIVMPLVCSAFIAAGWLTAYRCLHARRRVQDEDEVPGRISDPEEPVTTER
jgi:hypothetical protein